MNHAARDPRYFHQSARRSPEKSPSPKMACNPATFFEARESSISCVPTSRLISLAKNPVFHGRSKRIGVKYHYIRDLVNDGEIELEFCRTKEQVADIFTKGLSSDKFIEMFRQMLGASDSILCQ